MVTLAVEIQAFSAKYANSLIGSYIVPLRYNIISVQYMPYHINHCFSVTLYIVYLNIWPCCREGPLAQSAERGADNAKVESSSLSRTMFCHLSSWVLFSLLFLSVLTLTVNKIELLAQLLLSITLIGIKHCKFWLF